MVPSGPEFELADGAAAGAFAGAALTGAYVSVKNYGRVFVMVDIDQANAASMAISIEQASAVAGTGSKVITVAVPIWANEDCATNDTLVRQTDAVDFTTSAAVKVKKVVFEIDPATLAGRIAALFGTPAPAATPPPAPQPAAAVAAGNPFGTPAATRPNPFAKK